MHTQNPFLFVIQLVRLLSLPDITLFCMVRGVFPEKKYAYILLQDILDVANGLKMF